MALPRLVPPPLSTRRRPAGCVPRSAASSPNSSPQAGSSRRPMHGCVDGTRTSLRHRPSGNGSA